MSKKMEVRRATSVRNGIAFYSNKKSGFVALATIDENENIKTELTDAKTLYPNTEGNKSKYFLQSTIGLLFSLVIYVIVFGFPNFIITYDSTNFTTEYLTIVIRLIILGTLLISLAHFFKLCWVERKYNAFKFHSAEHMVLNAYRALQKIPTLDEIKKYSRLSNSCGTNLVIGMNIFRILALACTSISNCIHCIIAIVISFVVILVFSYLGFFNFFQLLNTRQPTDRELKVAIEGLRFWQECESQSIEEIDKKPDEEICQIVKTPMKSNDK